MTSETRNGFTLIELLVAISIFCVLIVTIYSSFMSGVSARRKGEQVVELTHTGFSVLKRISTELANCTDLEGYGFWGETDRLTFTTLKAQTADDVPAFCQVSYYLDEERPDQASLLRRSSQTVGGPYEEADLTASCIGGLRFTYGYEEGDDGLVEWTDTWTGDAENPLPLFVRVNLTLASEGETMRLGRTVAIPVARAPEVTDGVEAEL
jgi:prepilin-type N-terminal cleavage/methylation domain-containing protein